MGRRRLAKGADSLPSLEINSLIERTVGSVTFKRGMPGFTTDIIHSSFFSAPLLKLSRDETEPHSALACFSHEQREKEKESTLAS